MDDNTRLLREQLRRLVEENIQLEQRLLQYREIETRRLRETSTSRSARHLNIDLNPSRSASVLSNLGLLQRNDHTSYMRSLLGDYPALHNINMERQRQEMLIRELTANREPPDRYDSTAHINLRHHHGLEERLRELERLSRLEEIQLGAASLHHGRSANESLFPRLVPAPNDQAAILGGLPYAAAASMPLERSSELPRSSPSAKRILPSGKIKSEKGVVQVALEADGDFLTKYQVVLRQCLEFFTAQAKDADTSVQGRKHKLRVGQVRLTNDDSVRSFSAHIFDHLQIGLRCRFCCHLPIYQRGRGSVHFVKSIRKIYQGMFHNRAYQLLTVFQLPRTCLPPISFHHVPASQRI